MIIQNSKGQVFYGCHFYPGVAEYQEPGKDPFRVFLNENTIREMDPSFAGRPVFVRHIEGEVEEKVDELRKEADGWVIESFFNSADGKHWVKFIAVTERAMRAIKAGQRLSNCYRPTSFANGGTWNGMTYAKEITGGEYEHLAIVPDPRYEESVIMSPEEFKRYNAEKLADLDRLKNNKDDEGTMLKIFKRSKVENSADLETTVVELPKSKREYTILQLVNDRDELEHTKLANHSHFVEVDGKKLTVASLLEKFEALKNEMEDMKKKDKDEYENADDDMDDMENAEDDEEEMNEEDGKKKKNKMKTKMNKKKMNEDPDESGDPGHGKVDMASKDKMNKKKKNSADDGDDFEDGLDEDAARQAKEAQERAKRLRNANRNHQPEVSVDFAMDQVERGKQRYGS